MLFGSVPPLHFDKHPSFEILFIDSFHFIPHPHRTMPCSSVRIFRFFEHVLDRVDFASDLSGLSYCKPYHFEDRDTL